MARIVFEYDPPERFVAGTVGEPGQRTFFLQARGGGRDRRASRWRSSRCWCSPSASTSCSTRSSGRTAGEADVPAVDADRGWRTPPRWSCRSRRSSASARWRWPGTPTSERVVIEAHAVTEEAEDDDPPLIDDDDEDGPDALLRVRLTGRRGPGLRQAGPGRGRGRPAALPVLRRPARPRRPHLPAGQRLPPPCRRPSPTLGSRRLADVRERAGPAAARRASSTVDGRLVDASNATLFCAVDDGAAAGRCVYKPVAGERPLWDFPDGTLAGREVAAYVVSEAHRLGRRAADRAARRAVRARHGASCGSTSRREPERSAGRPSVPRRAAVPDGWLRVLDALDDDGRAGRRSVHADDDRAAPDGGASTSSSTTPTARAATCSSMPGGPVHGVDHGVTFHVEHKLRTVLWGWAGEPLGPPRSTVLRAAARRPAGRPRHPAGRPAVPPRGAAPAAVASTGCCARARLPFPVEGWPAIPWPPF